MTGKCVILYHVNDYIHSRSVNSKFIWWHLVLRNRKCLNNKDIELYQLLICHFQTYFNILIFFSFYFSDGTADLPVSSVSLHHRLQHDSADPHLFDEEEEVPNEHLHSKSGHSRLTEFLNQHISFLFRNTKFHLWELFRIFFGPSSITLY